MRANEILQARPPPSYTLSGNAIPSQGVLSLIRGSTEFLRYRSRIKELLERRRDLDYPYHHSDSTKFSQSIIVLSGSALQS